MKIEKQVSQAVNHISISDEEQRHLDMARQKAIYSQTEPSWKRYVSAPNLAYASIAILVVSISFITMNSPTTPHKQLGYDNELALLESKVPVELVEQLDFYMWLDSQQLSDKTIL